MFKTRKTINGQGKKLFSEFFCVYCGNPIPAYRAKGNIKYRPWFCSSTCSKYITPKISYLNLRPLKAKFIKDRIPLKQYDWNKKERNKYQEKLK